MRGADLIREARTRAGLTQDELAELSRRPRSLIARWEQGSVSPSIDNFLEMIEACGFELPLVLVERDKGFDDRLEKNRQLSPERRARRSRKKTKPAAGARARFDPYGILQMLDRRRVSYVVVGAFARVLQGTAEITRGIDIVPSTRGDNLRRLDEALRDLNARRADGHELDLTESAVVERPVLELATDSGDMKIVATPRGTRGYDDLRRAASREPLGRGVRPAVASIGDLARMASAYDRELYLTQLMQLRRLTALERGRRRAIER